MCNLNPISERICVWQVQTEKNSPYDCQLEEVDEILQPFAGGTHFKTTSVTGNTSKTGQCLTYIQNKRMKFMQLLLKWCVFSVCSTTKRPTVEQ